MLRFFEPEANTRRLASTPPPPQLDTNAAVPPESPTVALRRSSSLLAKVNLMKNHWLPSSLPTVADVNVSPSPSPDPSSAAANSSNAFGVCCCGGGGGGGDSGIFWQDAGGVLRRQATDPFPETVRGGRSSSSMAADTRRRSNQLDMLDWRKRRSMVHEEENKKIADLKRQKTSADEKLYLLPSFGRPSSPKMIASINQTIKEPVKNQKLGDKITALQQLVSPFGKTDTASVLQEATVYIKALHEQIHFQLLNRLHFEANSSRSIQGNGVSGRSRLNDRGLCIIPISSAILISFANQECPDYSIRELTNQLN
ncbi:hypothetical protein M5K25_019835 [Dendrobium thyrsiflorum]|uniref:BHLH domain-containing protein n=1 Tax=Dendrobium thyrsiflorum TaxID=117978 RepID=A0ABD0UFW8_DENTH